MKNLKIILCVVIAFNQFVLSGYQLKASQINEVVINHITEDGFRIKEPLVLHENQVVESIQNSKYILKHINSDNVIHTNLNYYEVNVNKDKKVNFVYEKATASVEIIVQKSNDLGLSYETDLDNSKVIDLLPIGEEFIYYAEDIDGYALQSNESDKLSLVVSEDTSKNKIILKYRNYKNEAIIKHGFHDENGEFKLILVDIEPLDKTIESISNLQKDGIEILSKEIDTNTSSAIFSVHGVNEQPIISQDLHIEENTHHKKSHTIPPLQLTNTTTQQVLQYNSTKSTVAEFNHNFVITADLIGQRTELSNYSKTFYSHNNSSIFEIVNYPSYVGYTLLGATVNGTYYEAPTDNQSKNGFHPTSNQFQFNVSYYVDGQTYRVIFLYVKDYNFADVEIEVLISDDAGSTWNVDTINSETIQSQRISTQFTYTPKIISDYEFQPNLSSPLTIPVNAANNKITLKYIRVAPIEIEVLTSEDGGNSWDVNTQYSETISNLFTGTQYSYTPKIVPNYDFQPNLSSSLTINVNNYNNKITLKYIRVADVRVEVQKSYDDGKTWITDTNYSQSFDNYPSGTTFTYTPPNIDGYQFQPGISSALNIIVDVSSANNLIILKYFKLSSVEIEVLKSHDLRKTWVIDNNYSTAIPNLIAGSLYTHIPHNIDKYIFDPETSSPLTVTINPGSNKITLNYLLNYYSYDHFNKYKNGIPDNITFNSLKYKEIQGEKDTQITQHDNEKGFAEIELFYSHNGILNEFNRELKVIYEKELKDVEVNTYYFYKSLNGDYILIDSQKDIAKENDLYQVQPLKFKQPNFDISYWFYADHKISNYDAETFEKYAENANIYYSDTNIKIKNNENSTHNIVIVYEEKPTVDVTIYLIDEENKTLITDNAVIVTDTGKYANDEFTVTLESFLSMKNNILLQSLNEHEKYLIQNGYELLSKSDQSIRLNSHTNSLFYEYKKIKEFENVTVEHINLDNNDLFLRNIFTEQIGVLFKAEPYELEGYEYFSEPKVPQIYIKKLEHGHNIIKFYYSKTSEPEEGNNENNQNNEKDTGKGGNGGNNTSDEKTNEETNPDNKNPDPEKETQDNKDKDKEIQLDKEEIVEDKVIFQNDNTDIHEIKYNHLTNTANNKVNIPPKQTLLIDTNLSSEHHDLIPDKIIDFIDNIPIASKQNMSQVSLYNNIPLDNKTPLSHWITIVLISLAMVLIPILLAFLIYNLRKNVKVYSKDKETEKLILIKKVHLSERNKMINLSKFNKDILSNLVIDLSDSIINKLLNKQISIIKDELQVNILIIEEYKTDYLELSIK